MEWPKLKNIILLMLVAVNVCLLAFVAQREWRESSQQQQARENAIALLGERGIQVSPQQVPETMTLFRQTVERDRAQEDRVAAALLGQSVRVEARGGEVYRYDTPEGSIQFHSDGSFSAALEPEWFPPDTQQWAGGQEILRRLSFEGAVLTQTPDTQTFYQLWQGAPLFHQQLTLQWSAEGGVSITAARRLMGQPERDSTRAPITVATALICFLNGLNTLGDVCSRIDSITQGYLSTATGSGGMALTPVWQITTDTGAYHLDTLTGELGRID